MTATVPADCRACGEAGQLTFADQWSGRPDVPPWFGQVPRCGFCFEPLTRRTAARVRQRCPGCKCPVYALPGAPCLFCGGPLAPPRPDPPGT